MSTGDQSSHPARHNRSRKWWITGAVVAAVLVALAAVLTVRPRSDNAAPGTTTSSPTAASPTTTTTSQPSTPPATTAPAAGDQLLWPFANDSEAAAWQRGYREGGHQPWHLDAGETAQSFTQGYLGYTTIDQITTTTINGTDARVGVGYKLPDGRMSTAAVIHLVKVGSGQDAPWEVVGTDDVATLTLTTPGYGSTVTSPVTVGGRITGVDESLRVQVLRLSEPKAIGQAGGIPAGGQNTAWTATVSFSAPADSVLTIAVSTGGHINDVERFAITGVRTGPAAGG